MISTTRPRLFSVVVISAPIRSGPSTSRARLIPFTASSWLFSLGRGRFLLWRSAGPSSEVDNSTPWALQKARCSSVSNARFDAITKSNCFRAAGAAAFAEMTIFSMRQN